MGEKKKSANAADGNAIVKASTYRSRGHDDEKEEDEEEEEGRRRRRRNRKTRSRDGSCLGLTIDLRTCEHTDIDRSITNTKENKTTTCDHVYVLMGGGGGGGSCSLRHTNKEQVVADP